MILNQTVVGRTNTAGERDLQQEEAVRANNIYMEKLQQQVNMDDTQSAQSSMDSVSVSHGQQSGQGKLNERNLVKDDDSASIRSVSTTSSANLRTKKRMPQSSYPGPAPPKLNRNTSTGSSSSRSSGGTSYGNSNNEKSSFGASATSASSSAHKEQSIASPVRNHDRVYAITDTDAAALLIPGSPERRGGLGLADGASEPCMGGTWINAIGANKDAVHMKNDFDVPCGQVVGYEYRREKFDAQGVPVPGSENVSVVTTTDNDSASALGSAQVSIADSYSDYKLGQYDYMGRGEGDLLPGGELEGRSISSEDLICGKLQKADKNSAVTKEKTREVKRGMSQAVMTMSSHSKMLLAGPGGITHNKDSGDKAVKVINRLAGSEGGIHADLDDGTIATDTLQLSTENNILHGIPEDIESPQAKQIQGGAGSPSDSDTVSILKHEQFKLLSNMPREKGGEHAAVHVYHDGFSAKERKSAPRGMGPGRTTTGRFKLNFSEPGGAADTGGGPQVMQLQEQQKDEHENTITSERRLLGMPPSPSTRDGHI